MFSYISISNSLWYIECLLKVGLKAKEIFKILAKCFSLSISTICFNLFSFIFLRFFFYTWLTVRWLSGILDPNLRRNPGVKSLQALQKWCCVNPLVTDVSFWYLWIWINDLKTPWSGEWRSLALYNTYWPCSTDSLNIKISAIRMSKPKQRISSSNSWG